MNDHIEHNEQDNLVGLEIDWNAFDRQQQETALINATEQMTQQLASNQPLLHGAHGIPLDYLFAREKLGFT